MTYLDRTSAELFQLVEKPKTSKWANNSQLIRLFSTEWRFSVRAFKGLDAFSVA